jgi:hypothetical protein
MSLYNKFKYAVDIFCADKDDLYKVYEAYKAVTPTENTASILYNTLYIDENKLDSMYETIELDDLRDIDKNYYPYLDIDTMFAQFTEFKENILIILGKPGLGKSKMINQYMKYILENPKYIDDEDEVYRVVYAKNQDMLAMDSFWTNIYGSDLVILDDLDFFLSAREQVVSSSLEIQKDAFISHLLSYTDGTTETNTKFIITTNRTLEEVDPALLRKGRAFDILELRPLHKDEALKIWKNNGLEEKDFIKELGMYDSIIQSDLGSLIAKKLKNSELLEKSYLKEEGVSKLMSMGKKRVGII